MQLLPDSYQNRINLDLLDCNGYGVFVITPIYKEGKKK
jgi:hypothetical protein